VPIEPGDRAAESFALGDDLLETLRVRLDVAAHFAHCALGDPGVNGGQDGFVLGEDHVRFLELAVLNGKHHQVEPELLGQLGVELVEPRAIQKPHDRGMERQVLIDDSPRVVRLGRLDERVEGFVDRGELFLGGNPRDRGALQPFARGVYSASTFSGVGEITTAPRFTSYRTRPLSSRMRTASRTVLRATPSLVAIALSRSRSPGAKPPAKIRSDRPSASCWAVVERRSPSRARYRRRAVLGYPR
jgi:hypothetical protein